MSFHRTISTLAFSGIIALLSLLLSMPLNAFAGLVKDYELTIDIDHLSANESVYVLAPHLRMIIPEQVITTI